MPSSDPAAPMTRAQADHIIRLLESRSHSRVPVAMSAARASDVLSGVAVLAFVLGGLGVLSGVIVLAHGGVVAGLLTIVASIASAGLYWGLLTTASVVAGYVANRSE